MPIKFSDTFASAWRTDAIGSTPAGNPPSPISTTFPSAYFTNINLVDGGNNLTNDIQTNLRVSGGNNAAFFAAPVGSDYTLGELSGLFFGDTALHMPAPIHTGVVPPNFAYRPTKDPTRPESLVYVTADNTLHYCEYNFTTDSFVNGADTNPSYDYTSGWKYGGGTNIQEFDTNSGELGMTENVIIINKTSQTSGNIALFIDSMDLATALIITQAADEWQYTITNWTDNGNYITLAVTLGTSTVAQPAPTGTFDITFRWAAAYTATEYSGYTWSQMIGARKLLVSGNKPFALISTDPAAGTDSFVGWWDFGGSATILRNAGYNYDRQTLAAIPLEGTSLYSGWPAPGFAAATFNDAGNDWVQIMNLNTGTVTQASTVAHRYIKTIPKCTNGNDNCFLVGYGESTNDGLYIYEVDAAGMIVGTSSDTIISGAGARVNSVAFIGEQYNNSVGTGTVTMFLSTNNGEYRADFAPTTGTITCTNVSTVINTANTAVMVKGSPFNDTNGFFLMANCDGTSSAIDWFNLNKAGLSPIAGNYANSGYSPRKINYVEWKDMFDGNQFVKNSGGSGWLLCTETDGAGQDGGPHYVPGATGTHLSSWKEALSSGSKIMTASNHDHNVTWLWNGITSEAVVYGDTGTTNWKVSRASPVAT